jgi:hypothetical protein
MGDYMISPVAAAQQYFFTYEHRNVAGTAEVTIMNGPVHGKLVDEGIDEGILSVAGTSNEHTFSHRSAPGYIAKDQATILVDIGGYEVKVRYFLQAVNRGLGNEWINDLCRKSSIWKIASGSKSGPAR